ncbi:zinc finger protein [Trema orientale]|uniref:Zinc finger protein n=1 Tax=Trema orientale TaxID=63057 RepID=A0A2P5FNV7_TREOI|nr:zinc finger protein [Trema orientale]
MGEGREGDWECSGCRNRNYAFRSFCNRCKQPRLLVDNNTPADSKWLPRIGDWICTGCTNNNYASREKCKKCGQPKEVAAMPAIAMPGASLPTYSHYFARVQGGAEQKMNIGLTGNGALQQCLPLASSWPVAGPDKYGIQPASTWSLGGNPNSGFPYANPTSQLHLVPKGWRNGDWICSCGFHNYSSRAQCKKCNAFPPALGTKRLASEEFVHDWDNKRLNIGHTNGQHQSYPGFEPPVGTTGDSKPGAYTSYSSVSSGVAPNSQVPMLLPQQATAPTLLGKGAKQWREGDWMCSNCNNHNYASRSECNRCKTQKDAQSVAQSVNAI